MAVPQDYTACQRKWPSWKDRLDEPIQSIVHLSPDSKQAGILRGTFPSADITEKTIGNWDLNDSALFSCGLIVACNIFHYAAHPTIWFKNVFKACRYFWIQDLFARHRGDPVGLGSDGDQVRYGLGGVFASHTYTFDLSQYKDRLIDFECYDAGSMVDKRAAINFIACFRGDL